LTDNTMNICSCSVSSHTATLISHTLCTVDCDLFKTKPISWHSGLHRKLWRSAPLALFPPPPPLSLQQVNRRLAMGDIKMAIYQLGHLWSVILRTFSLPVPLSSFITVNGRRLNVAQRHTWVYVCPLWLGEPNTGLIGVWKGYQIWISLFRTEEWDLSRGKCRWRVKYEQNSRPRVLGLWGISVRGIFPCERGVLLGVNSDPPRFQVKQTQHITKLLSALRLDFKF
jgi:hypothetical protein